MTDVLVHRCTVRIVRHGGWSWGPRPRAFVDQALRALPDLIAAQLDAEAAPFAASVSIEAPVRVAARLRLREFLDGGAPLVTARLAVPLRAAVREAIEADAASPDALDDSRGLAATGRAASVEEAAARPAAAVDPLAVLFEWEARGVLRELLELLPEPVLGALLGSDEDDVQGVGLTPGVEVLEAVRRAAERNLRSDDHARRLRALLAAVVDLAARGRAPRLELLSAARTLCRPVRHASPGPADDGPLEEPAAEAIVVTRVREPATPAQRHRARALDEDGGAPPKTRVVGRALPFLLLQPLSQIGYLDALGSALAAAGELPRAAAFAAALAFKVLDPPARGWRREQRDDATATAFAGHAVHLSEDAITALARRADRFAPLLAAVVADVVVRGRPRGAEIAVVRTRAGRLFALDPNGCFIIAAGELTPALRATAPDVAYADDVEARDVLRSLRIRTRALRHHPALDVDRVDACADAFAARSGAARAETGELERSLELAAWTALATVSWTLWHEREPTDPLLALERLGDLGAQIDFAPDRLSVTLPLGRRSLDLQEHGLLGTVAAPPWLPDRVVELGSG